MQIVAGLVNIGLNYLLIPKYGSLGAAIATSTTLGVWAMWRLVEAEYLLRCFPFHKISFSMLTGTVLASVLLKELLEGQRLWIQIIAVVALTISFMTISLMFGRKKKIR